MCTPPTLREPHPATDKPEYTRDTHMLLPLLWMSNWTRYSALRMALRGDNPQCELPSGDPRYRSIAGRSRTERDRRQVGAVNPATGIGAAKPSRHHVCMISGSSASSLEDPSDSPRTHRRLSTSTKAQASAGSGAQQRSCA